MQVGAHLELALTCSDYRIRNMICMHHHAYLSYVSTSVGNTDCNDP